MKGQKKYNYKYDFVAAYQLLNSEDDYFSHTDESMEQGLIEVDVVCDDQDDDQHRYSAQLDVEDFNVINSQYSEKEMSTLTYYHIRCDDAGAEGFLNQLLDVFSKADCGDDYFCLHLLRFIRQIAFQTDKINKIPNILR